MKPIDKKSGKKKAFTIIELLTVMSVIVLLIGLLAPALQSFKRYAKKIKQKSQFHSIEVALDLYNAENEEYPPSNDAGGYCGSQKLCEALMGQDLLGFHPGSTFSITTENKYLYTNTAGTGHIRILKGPSLQLDNANAHPIAKVIPSLPKTSDPNYVLCDVYTTGTREGMPILYYKADKSRYDGSASPTTYIVNVNDNFVISDLSAPTGWNQSIFQTMIRNHNVAMVNWPHRADSYILHSAGFDSKYGTADDIFNFERTDLGY